MHQMTAFALLVLLTASPAAFAQGIPQNYGDFLGSSVDFLDVKDSLEAHELAFLSAETGYVPQNLVAVSDKTEAGKVLRLINFLDENDDVQNVYANYDIPDEWIEELTP